VRLVQARNKTRKKTKQRTKKEKQTEDIRGQEANLGWRLEAEERRHGMRGGYRARVSDEHAYSFEAEARTRAVKSLLMRLFGTSLWRINNDLARRGTWGKELEEN